MKIVFFEVNKQQQNIFKNAFPHDELLFYGCKLTDEVAPEVHDAEVISVFVCSKITAGIIKQCPNLKLIVTRSTGFDNIAIKAAQEHGVVVCNIPVYADETVAEYVFALLLALSRKIYDAYLRVSQKHSFSLVGLQGFDLAGKMLGVVGMGNIGKHVVRIAIHGFQMKVVACDKYKDEAFAKRIGFSYVPFEELLAQSDIITLHVPLTKQTTHMINMDTIKKIKSGAYLINTARGPIVETKALIKALEAGILAGAGLDVLEEECFTHDPLLLLNQEHPHSQDLRILLENNYLINHPQVIVTPHNAFNSVQALERLTKTSIDEIKAWQRGEPINVVT
jgi:D-lactate dehydrogenase